MENWSNFLNIFFRFEKRIYIPLPEASARVKMFELHMGNIKHCIQPTEFRDLAEKTEGWGQSNLLIGINNLRIID